MAGLEVVAVRVVIRAVLKVVIQEWKELIGVDDRVNSFDKELRLMQSWFEDVEAKDAPSEDEKKWADKAEEIFLEIEEVVDIFQSKSARYRRGGNFKRSFFVLDHLFARLKVRMKVHKIQAQIEVVSEGKPNANPNPTRMLNSQLGPSFSQETAQITHAEDVHDAITAVGGIKGRKGPSSAVEIQPEIYEITETSNITNLEGAQPVSLHARGVGGFTFQFISIILRRILRLYGFQVSDSLEEDVESIKKYSSLMDALFEDVWGIEIQDRRLNAWVKKMHDVRRNAEAAIDYYNETTESRRWSFIKRVKMEKKIYSTMRKIQDFSERRLKYNIGHIKRREESATISRSPHHTPPSIIEQPNIAGFSNDVQAVLAQLLTNDKNCCIIPIVGMEGIGKTTLARLIFNNNAVSYHFPCRAWVSAPSYYNIEALLKGIEEQVLMGIQEQNREPILVADLKEKVLVGLQEQKGKQIVEEPMQMLNEVLTSTRYLIVLDDVRTTEVWDRLLKEFPSTLHGSRIILTTRDIGIATHANPKSDPHKLQLLSDDDSWALFIRTLTIPDGLLEQSKKMVTRCGGLPWAIVELRKQFLGVESSFNAWSSVLKNLNNGQKPWLKTLEAIKVLPSNLKRCISYLRRFPAEFEISLRRLIVLWIAEGVVHQRRGMKILLNL